MAWAVIAGLVALGIGFPVVTYFQGHYNESAIARYAIPLLPLIGLAIARGSRRFGIVSVGLALPIAAAIVQLAVLKY